MPRALKAFLVGLAIIVGFFIVSTIVLAISPQVGRILGLAFLIVPGIAVFRPIKSLRLSHRGFNLALALIVGVPIFGASLDPEGSPEQVSKSVSFSASEAKLGPSEPTSLRSKIQKPDRDPEIFRPAPIKGSSYQTRTMYVDASKLNVRDGPSKTATQVWTLKRDEKVTVVEENGDWRRVKSSRYNGWVFGTYLTGSKAPTRTEESLAKLQPAKPTLSTAKIAQILIERSIAYYTGNCPCPYNRTRSGRRCGGNSAYSRPGGDEPLCFPADVTAKMVSDYRARQ